MSDFHIDRFDSTLDLPKKQRTYEAIKARVLEAGGFSCFEAQDDPHTFNRLVRDPELEKVELGYPWVGLRRRLPAPPETP